MMEWDEMSQPSFLKFRDVHDYVDAWNSDGFRAECLESLKKFVDDPFIKHNDKYIFLMKLNVTMYMHSSLEMYYMFIESFAKILYTD